MAAHSKSDLFRKVTEAVCNGGKSPEIQIFQDKFILSLQDEVATFSHRSILV